MIETLLCVLYYLQTVQVLVDILFQNNSSRLRQSNSKAFTLSKRGTFVSIHTSHSHLYDSCGDWFFGSSFNDETFDRSKDRVFEVLSTCTAFSLSETESFTSLT